MNRRTAGPHRALLLCNGEPPARLLARRAARICDLVVAADGGANHARALGLSPDVIIGDLDSVRQSTLRAFRNALVVRVERQDNTDVEKALEYLRDRGVRTVLLMGATGSRIDMTLANLTVLWRYARSLDIMVIGDGWHAVPVQGARRLHAGRGTTVSLLPCAPCRGVTLRGLHYPLTNASFRPGEVAVSNIVRSSPFSVNIKEGRALVVVMESPVAAGRRRQKPPPADG